MSSALSMIPWLVWWAAILTLAGWLSMRFWGGDARVFLPGETTHGHYQIELDCSACHSDDGGVDEERCLSCHQAGLDAVDDSHPKSKFRDIRKAHLLERIDASKCLTCHQEHVPERTKEMGLSVPSDYCVHCHQDIASERPTHEGLDHMSCATAGCHNYHDNRALYYEFLKRHADEPDMAPEQRRPARDFASRWAAKHGGEAATAPDASGHGDGATVDDWLASAHAQAGINCTACHAPEGQPWQDRVDHETCASCHQTEVAGWKQGLHGMRVAAGLAPMTPGQARLPMHAEVAHQELNCLSCHGAHRFDTVEASVNACLTCHADNHSQAYLQSAHYLAWLDEQAGDQPAGSGVSCATCHMPRVEEKLDGGKVAIRVEHNQNRFFKPNEKMIRSSCQHCHGLGFAIDALADPALIESNFQGRPNNHIPSIDWVRAHESATRKPADR